MKRTQIFSIFPLALSLIICSGCQSEKAGSQDKAHELDPFLITKQELTLEYSHAPGERRFSFGKTQLSPEEWKKETRVKLAQLLKVREPETREVKEQRSTEYQGVVIRALVMKVSENLTIPAYLLAPADKAPDKSAVMAIHGHGSVEPCIGLRDDYHHFFALELAKDGHLVLAPELRGFSTLRDLAYGIEINRLDYWIGGYSQFTLVTDAFLYGDSVIGQTVTDLLCWEEWLFSHYDAEELDVTGISYGGDLAIIYPAFSHRVRRIFASGSMGSFSVIFERCYNAPAHCIPSILQWMDRSDIAGLSAPRPIVVHFGELDTPSSTNASASYNETVPQSMEELRAIYRAFDAEEAVSLLVSPGSHHEMDIPALLDFLNK